MRTSSDRENNIWIACRRGIWTIGAKLILTSKLWAQCVLCKTSLQNQSPDAAQQVNAFNDSILYLLAIPYLTLGVVGYLWYRHTKKHNAT